MALDRQKILNELGSVVNQLQSADCGCMGKLFSDSNGPQAVGMTPQSNCGMWKHNHCPNYGSCNTGHGHAPCSAPRIPNMCLGQCNPPKLYADTYSFLNNNLMQPVVNEVYNDLKSITPENIIMNNSIGAKMGLPCARPQMNGDMQMQQNMMGGNNQPQIPNSTPPNMIQNQLHNDNMVYQTQSSGIPQMQSGAMGYQSQAMNDNTVMLQNQIQGSGMDNQLMSANGQQMNNQDYGRTMAGMGPQIMKMMSSGKGFNSPQATSPGTMNPGQNNFSHAINQEQYDPIGMNQQNYAANAGAQQQFNVGMSNTIPQTMTNTNIGRAFNPNGPQSMNTNMLQGQGDHSLSNQVPVRQMSAPARTHGQHTHGMNKFKEMFPGVTDGDLGFDPMTIALQMNPANQQKVAMAQMQKIMEGKSGRSSHMEKLTANENAARANLAQINQSELAPAPTSQSQPTNMNTGVDRNQQQIYSASSGALTHPGQPAQKIIPQHQYQEQQEIVDSSAVAPVTSNKMLLTPEEVSRGNNIVNDTQPDNAEPDYGKLMIKEPIFPADISKFHPPLSMKRTKYYEYNTLGQPVEKLPAKLFNRPLESGPQTLYPQPVTKLRSDYKERFGLKQTESKTSLVGKAAGKVPSRNQMQHLYNQYKGSVSDTQQRPPYPSSPTHSEKHIKVPPRNMHQMPLAPIETVGDTEANNYTPIVVNAIPEKSYQQEERIGDVPAPKPLDNISPPQPLKKSRNGLQDQKQSAYTGSVAWSFHGERSIPLSMGHPFRYRKM